MMIRTKWNGFSLKRLTLRKAIRMYCIDCVGSAKEIKKCRGNKLNFEPCPLYEYRTGKNNKPKVKWVRKNCLLCMSGSSKSVANCHTKTCWLHLYRSGKNPKRIKMFKLTLKRPL